MYKIKYLKTGHTFLLPEETAKDLKKQFPDEYKILEKNGKKFNDKIKSFKTDFNSKCIKELIIEK